MRPPDGLEGPVRSHAHTHTHTHIPVCSTECQLARPSVGSHYALPFPQGRDHTTRARATVSGCPTSFRSCLHACDRLLSGSSSVCSSCMRASGAAEGVRGCQKGALDRVSAILVDRDSEVRPVDLAVHVPRPYRLVTPCMCSGLIGADMQNRDPCMCGTPFYIITCLTR